MRIDETEIGKYLKTKKDKVELSVFYFFVTKEKKKNEIPKHCVGAKRSRSVCLSIHPIFSSSAQIADYEQEWLLYSPVTSDLVPYIVS